MYQFQPFAAIISPFALSTCNWPLTLWCCCCWGPRTMVEGDVDILQMMWSWCDPLKASLQLHWPIIRRPRSMLRVTPLMLHHYCPSLWCDHVRVGKLSASTPVLTTACHCHSVSECGEITNHPSHSCCGVGFKFRIRKLSLLKSFELHPKTQFACAEGW